MSDTEAPAPPSAEIRDRLGEAVTSLAELRKLPETKRGDTYAADLRLAKDEVLDLDAMLRSTATVEDYDLRRYAFENAGDTGTPQPKGPSAAFTELGERAVRSLGVETVLRDEYRSWAGDENTVPSDRMPELKLERSLLSPEMRTLLDESGDDNAAFFVPTGQPIAPTPRQQRFWLRDVLSVQTTGLSAIPYIRELNPATNETAATGVAEGAAKPEVVMEFEEDTAVVKKIAAWIPATMEILADAPTLAGYINTRLAYMLKVRETAQIINGAGTGAQLKGVLQFSGVQTQATVADDPYAVIGLSIGKIENVDGEANGVAMNALDFWLAVTERHSTQFDGQPTGGSVPFGAPDPTVWGLPVVRTRALSQGDVIVADWARGATLFDRMQTTIRQSDSHDDYFVKNKVAILAEERIALAVHRPDFFVDASITFT